MSDQESATEVPVEKEQPLIHGVPASLSRGQLVVHPDRDNYLRVAGRLQDDGYRMFVDLTGADYLFYRDRPLPPGVQPERFEVVLGLLSFSPPRRIRLRVQVPESDPTIPTLFELYPGSETMEREAYDMYGIVFTGHPDMTRILMPEDWEGHPLRKDYGVGRIPVQFKGAPPPR